MFGDVDRRGASVVTLVDPGWPVAANAFMARLGAGLLASLRSVGLGMDRYHARRRGRRNLCCLGFPFLFGDALTGRQKHECRDLGAEPRKAARLFFSERTPYRGLNQLPRRCRRYRRRFHGSRHTTNSPSAQVHSYFNRPRCTWLMSYINQSSRAFTSPGASVWVGWGRT